MIVVVVFQCWFNASWWSVVETFVWYIPLSLHMKLRSTALPNSAVLSTVEIDIVILIFLDLLPSRPYNVLIKIKKKLFLVASKGLYDKLFRIISII